MKTRSQAPLAGIACMVGGGALLTLNDVTVKWLSTDYPIGEIMSLRGLFVFLPIALIAGYGGGLRALEIRNLGAQGARAALTLLSTVFYLTALAVMPIADTIAITFAGPLFLTMLATPLLGEPVGWRRWTAVVVGFVGVVVMVRPGTGTLQAVALLPVAAALMGALRDIITRRITSHIARAESSVAILCFTTLVVILGGLLTLPFGWRLPSMVDLGLLALSGFLLGAAHYLLIEAFRFAEVGLIAPFKYISIVWAVLLGFLVWGDIPDRWIVIGAGLVIGSGLYIFHREAVSHTRAP
ncbi:MAG: DMT family transporter [Proteobacteria bacterium]|nr:DMT family transporter [Pseudomonadota bacterium]